LNFQGVSATYDRPIDDHSQTPFGTICSGAHSFSFPIHGQCIVAVDPISSGE